MSSNAEAEVIRLRQGLEQIKARLSPHISPQSPVLLMIHELLAPPKNTQQAETERLRALERVAEASAAWIAAEEGQYLSREHCITACESAQEAVKTALAHLRSAR